MTVAFSRREGENHFRAVLVVPVINLVPTLARRVTSILSVKNILRIFRALPESVLSNPFLGIEVEPCQQSGSPGLGPLPLIHSVSPGSGFNRQFLHTFLEFAFDEIEDFLWLNLSLRVF